MTIANSKNIVYLTAHLFPMKIYLFYFFTQVNQDFINKYLENCVQKFSSMKLFNYYVIKN